MTSKNIRKYIAPDNYKFETSKGDVLTLPPMMDAIPMKLLRDKKFRKLQQEDPEGALWDVLENTYPDVYGKILELSAGEAAFLLEGWAEGVTETDNPVGE